MATLPARQYRPRGEDARAQTSWPPQALSCCRKCRINKESKWNNWTCTLIYGYSRQPGRSSLLRSGLVLQASTLGATSLCSYLQFYPRPQVWRRSRTSRSIHLINVIQVIQAMQSNQTYNRPIHNSRSSNHNRLAAKCHSLQKLSMPKPSSPNQGISGKGAGFTSSTSQ